MSSGVRRPTTSSVTGMQVWTECSASRRGGTWEGTPTHTQGDGSRKDVGIGNAGVTSCQGRGEPCGVMRTRLTPATAKHLVCTWINLSGEWPCHRATAGDSPCCLVLRMHTHPQAEAGPQGKEVKAWAFRLCRPFICTKTSMSLPL